jgi:methylenetetrahydrofolate dehydrogenase (NADP+)/methenyltetrahydrofolate cyclohydrolase
MKILDGKKLSLKIREELKSKILELKEASKNDVSLVILQIGDNSSSNLYIKNKVIFAEKIGALCEVVKFPGNVSEKEILGKIKKLNDDEKVNGIILQLPIGNQLNKSVIINYIKPEKDVDGLGNVNLGKLVNNEEDGITPATSRGISTLLKENEINVEGKNVLVIGRSVLVGKSSALNLLNKNATVTVCHSKTENLNEHIKRADIIISATGSNGVVNSNNLGQNQILVDVGISIIDEKIIGDLKLESLDHDKINALSPVPGGVGPMTVASLFQNLLQAWHLQNK